MENNLPEVPVSQYKPVSTEWRPKWAVELSFVSLLTLAIVLFAGVALLFSSVNDYRVGAGVAAYVTQLEIVLGFLITFLAILISYPLLAFITRGGRWAFWTGEALFGLLVLTWLAFFLV